MKQLTFEEFRKLSRDEQNNRYCEMSDHDKFLARINAPVLGEDDSPDLTPEEIAALPLDLQQLFRDLENED